MQRGQQTCASLCVPFFEQQGEGVALSLQKGPYFKPTLRSSQTKTLGSWDRRFEKDAGCLQGCAFIVTIGTTGSNVAMECLLDSAFIATSANLNACHAASSSWLLQPLNTCHAVPLERSHSMELKPQQAVSLLIHTQSVLVCRAQTPTHLPARAPAGC